MAAIIRFFSRRFMKKPTIPQHSGVAEMTDTKSSSKKKKESDIECVVEYLDEARATFFLPKRSRGETLAELAYAYIGLCDEREFFGLMYFEKKVKMWLDPTKSIKKQYIAGSPFVFYMKVKFFSSEPHLLRDEYARYLYVLQLRSELLNGQIRCPDDPLAVELSALLIQSETGNYDANKHTPLFVSTFHFLPEPRHTESFELAILREYKKLGPRDLKPAECDRMFLERIRFLPDYGVDMHTVQGKDRECYRLGLTPIGILIYEGVNKIGLFVWNNILKLEMKGKKLKLIVSEEDESAKKVMEHTFEFLLPDSRACKHLWKCAIEQHTFFRLADPVKPPSKLQQFFRIKSRFHASFKTEYQLNQQSNFGSSSFRRRDTSGGQSVRSNQIGKGIESSSSLRQTSFKRIPSKRYSGRPSFASQSQRTPQRLSSPPISPQAREVPVSVNKNNLSPKKTPSSSLEKPTRQKQAYIAPSLPIAKDCSRSQLQEYTV